ncbi:conserved hypothetical protein [Talaromyces stipitatus ATCC 10500]|uniref:S-adenosyl-L-methionine:L-histidine 3-amino-3-carboxypropyltransferase 2 n=1 Tax=Talaromyces stipitatus (strain ATCC 10500 / CBS 375.48 / QM 6759 / NRRL 1006) TaxID=441959 RepID=B8MEC3_TALSN|nr:uncharacterized protein TSTA_016290 [Talaromyces stipitatus ATCC 10500]EED16550.1 conserved hypothetical protein [Talaromyces stipitatus ATCC 10500]
MMASAPILSTPDTHLLEATEPVAKLNDSQSPRSDEELSIIYDIERTLAEIRQTRWKRIALQFPDEMLPDAPRIFQLLTRGLQKKNVKSSGDTDPKVAQITDADSETTLAEKTSQLGLEEDQPLDNLPRRFYILADTSYGTCCVDEVAAEHVDADAVVHYGRACLSPTSRLPVIYVFTHRPLPIEPLVKAFKSTYTDLTAKIIIAADVTYTDHVQDVHDRLVQEGYTNLFAAHVVHNPASAIPNRTVPASVEESADSLSEWELFHISDPPTALLLTLSSKVAAIHIYPTENVDSEQDITPLQASTTAALRRRYGVLVSLSTAPIFGILVNTLSVKNYLHIVDHVRKQIAAAGKKSYMFVVGKLNAAKVANFSEIEGWVVIGCWESSLVDSKDFWKPVITPYELELALQSDDTRIWSGAWRSDYQAVLDASSTPAPNATAELDEVDDNDGSESESAPPEFDFRTGQFVTTSRPMQYTSSGSHRRAGGNSTTLAKRAKGDLAMIGNTISPGAEFLRSQRTWKGLGSDFEIKYEEDDEVSGSAVVEGRRGIARGYAVGDSSDQTIFQLYHTSSYLRNFLQSYPTAWKFLSFRLLFPSGSQNRPLLMGSPDPASSRQSRPYALDQLLMLVVIPISPCLKSLELDNTAVSGQILISTVLHSRRETLEHLSVRGCKNVSLKYHIIPYLTMYGLQYDVDMGNSGSVAKQKLALKSLYTYRCRHHRRRPYLGTSLARRDSDAEPTHELVNLCHKLGIWTDTAWCTTPAGRCLRRRGYVSMRVPHGAPEVWVVFDRLWRSKNWLGPMNLRNPQDSKRDGRLWEQEETGYHGEALGTGDWYGVGDGKFVPAHLRYSHRFFVESIKCDNCSEPIGERCEQCSVIMHCVGCRKTLCASCAYSYPYIQSQVTWSQSALTPMTNPLWWAPNATVSPCNMHDPPPDSNVDNIPNPAASIQYPNLTFHWCCTEPIFSGGGGISVGTTTRDVDVIRAAPLPKARGWEDPEFPGCASHSHNTENSSETSTSEGLHQLIGPQDRQVSSCPRNLCGDCYNSPQWKVQCKSCSKPLCKEHDLRGLRLRICGYKELAVEKAALQSIPLPGPSRTNSSNPSTQAGPSFFRPRINTAAAFMSQLQSQGPTPNMDRDSPSASSSVAGDHVGQGVGEMHPAALQDFIRARGHAEEGMATGRRAGRSRSPTYSSLSRSSSRSSVYYDAAAEITKWQGCRSYFCPQYRPLGDQRQRCPSVLRECTNCSINVCQDCVNNNPPCSCSYCEVNYLCPNCLKIREEDGTCRRVEEEKARKEEKWKRDMEMLEDILERKIANEVAEFAGEFLDLISDGMRTNLLSDFHRSLEQMSALAQGNMASDPAHHPLSQLQQQLPQAGLLQTHDEGDIEHGQFTFDHNNSDEDMINDELITPIAD